jgi:hypothetical protein
VEEIFESHQVKSRVMSISKTDGKMFVTFNVKGNYKQFALMERSLVRMESIVDFY